MMHLAGTGTFRPTSPVVFIQIATGVSHCELLERAIRRGPLARELDFPYHPHVTVAQEVADAALDEAYDGLSGFVARFPVEQLRALLPRRRRRVDVAPRVPAAAGRPTATPTRYRARQRRCRRCGGRRHRVDRSHEADRRGQARWQRAQDQHAWLRHVLAAYALLQRNNGNQYAAAITFFSFLALFPLLLLAVSSLGFVLYAHPDLQRSVFSHITSAVPGRRRQDAARRDPGRDRRTAPASASSGWSACC